jgi:hypothetical protein
MSKWFQELMPLYALMIHGSEKITADPTRVGFVEGVVFTHPDGRMAKLRKDMFDWYKGTRHKEERQ